MSGPDNPSIWVKKDTQLQADCRVFKVLKSRFSHSLREVDGDFFVIDAPDWVTVVAITPQSELVAVNQFRYGIEAL